MNDGLQTEQQEPDRTTSPTVAAGEPGRPPRSPAPERKRPRRGLFAWGNTAGGTVLVLVVALAWVVLGSRPLWHTDLWGHLTYGRLIWHNGRIPEAAPLLPLAEGAPFIDTAWLSQLGGFLLIRQFGVTALQALAGALVALTGGVLMGLGWRKTGSLAWALAGGGIWLWLEWKQLFAGGAPSLLIRPQMVGMLAFALTLAIVAARARWWHWIAVPILFALWANLHGSFAVGLALIGMFALGRACDLLRRSDRFGVIFLDWPFWRFILLGELAAAAALLNPYGLRLFVEIWLFSNNPNLPALVEWQPLTLRMFQGQAAAGAALLLIVLYRMTPRRIQTAEVLALLILGGMTLWTSRMIVWWGPIATWCAMRHGAALWQPFRTKGLWGEKKRRRVRCADHPKNERPAHLVRTADPTSCSGEARRNSCESRDGVWWRRPNPLWSLLSLALLAGALVATPCGATQFRGQSIPFSAAVSARTPLGAAGHLIENPPEGLVYNAMELGDFLLWTHPDLPLFAASHVHLLPANVWQAYLDILNSRPGWSSLLDRYGVQAIVLDRARRQTLIDRIAETGEWRLSYQDNRTAVFRRREAVPPPPDS